MTDVGILKLPQNKFQPLLKIAGEDIQNMKSIEIYHCLDHKSYCHKASSLLLLPLAKLQQKSKKVVLSMNVALPNDNLQQFYGYKLYISDLEGIAVWLMGPSWKNLWFLDVPWSTEGSLVVRVTFPFGFHLCCNYRLHFFRILIFREKRKILSHFSRKTKKNRKKLYPKKLPKLTVFLHFS